MKVVYDVLSPKTAKIECTFKIVNQNIALLKKKLHDFKPCFLI